MMMSNTLTDMVTNQLQDLRCDDSGQDLVEYALLGCLIAVAVVASVRTVALTVGGEFSTIGSKLIAVL